MIWGNIVKEKLQEALEDVKKQVESEFQEGHPYATINLARLKKDLDIKRGKGINVLIGKLRENYRIGKDRNWLIIEQHPEK